MNRKKGIQLAVPKKLQDLVLSTRHRDQNLEWILSKKLCNAIFLTYDITRQKKASGFYEQRSTDKCHWSHLMTWKNPLLPLTMTASLGTWNTGVYCLFIGIRNGQPGSNQLGTEYRWTEMCFIASWKQFMTTSMHRSSHLTTSPMQEGIVLDIFISSCKHPQDWF